MTQKQQLFTEILAGALIYSVVLGFFNDYTDILYTSSYSVTFMAAILMQSLVYPTFKLKGVIARWFKQKSGRHNKVAMVFSVWAVMFFSKFVFLGALNFAFGESIEISGFIGLVAIIVSATILTKLSVLAYKRLG